VFWGKFSYCKKNPPVPVFQKLDESAVFMKELGKGLWVVLYFVVLFEKGSYGSNSSSLVSLAHQF
jgi:hypothetical protein